MTLSVASKIAYTALMSTQVQMNVTSANIANADTAGYTKKTATQSSLVTAGYGSGTSITGISSTVDKFLLKSLLTATSQLGSASTLDSYTSQLQALFGSTSSDSGTSIANTLATFQSALSSLADTPESSTLKAQAVSALDAVASQLRDTSTSIQSLRSDADDAISDAVTNVNSVLKNLGDLNSQIASASASGQPTADLEDQRNTALQQLSSYMDVSSYVTGDNQLRVYTSSGQSLLDTQVHKLSYTSVGSVAATTALSPITVDGTDITSKITSGTIGALVNLRDKVLPAAQSELDNLAANLAGALNTVSNQGTAIPAPSSLTGAAAVSSSTPLSATGTVRIAVTDSGNALVSYQDLDLSSYATVGDLVSAIDGVSGVSASIDSSGHVVILADASGKGVAVNEMDSAVGTAGDGLSDWLGLNDIVSGTTASNFAVSASLLANPSLLPSGSLDSSATLTVGATVISVGSTKIVDALSDAMTGKTSFGAAGNLAASKTSFSEYASQIVTDVASTASTAAAAHTSKEGVQSSLAASIASQSGVNLDEETAKLSELQNLYAAATQIISTTNTMFQTLLAAVQTT
jgi:flagellar hook-associated protein 1 FlgK